jgi:signal peptidase II
MSPPDRAEDGPGRTEATEGAPPTAGGVRTKMALWLYGTAVVLYAADRITKVLAENHLPGHNRTLIPGVLQLQYTTNPGGAFSLFDGATWLFLTATLVVSAVIVFASFNLHTRTLAIALGLVLGGAMGNLTDRIVRGPGLTGRVVDFLAFATGPNADPWWPVFNLADSAIVIGAALILVSSLWRGARGRR